MRQAIEELRLASCAGSALPDDQAFTRALKEARVLFLFMLEKGGGAERWRPGKGRELAHAIAEATDVIVLACASRAGALPQDAALVVTGGGGRGEASPFSDLDLLLAFGGTPDAEGLAWASRLMRLLWDSGLVGNMSVRTWAECKTDSGSDIQFFTSLISGRCLLGDRETVIRLIAGISDGQRVSSLKEFVQGGEGGFIALGEDGSLFAREPDLKNGAGGLRTLHRMEWLGLLAGDPAGSRAYRAAFSPRDLRRIDNAYDFQLTQRIRLHFRKGREVDKLSHEDIAGLVLQASPAAVERFSTTLVQSRRTLALAEFAWREKTLGPHTLRPTKMAWSVFGSLSKRLRPHREPGARGFRLCEGLVFPLEGTKPDTLRALEALAPVARGEAGYSAELVFFASRAARSRSKGMGGREIFSAFREILNSRRSSEALVALDLSGLLSSLIPPYGLVRDQVTSQSFHDLPIGPHSIRAVSFADTLLGPAFEESRNFSNALALIAGRYRETGWIVKLALLLHDSGKAYEGDHAKNGAELAASFLDGLPTEPLIKAMIVDLVENHLLLSSASRRSDPLVPGSLAGLEAEFALKPYPEDAVGLLALVTACDIAATNPKAWSGYRATRFESLVTALDSGLSRAKGEAPQLFILADRVASLEAIDRKGDLRAFARRLGDRYTLANPPGRIAKDFFLFSENHLSRYDVDVIAENDHIKVKVFAPDEVGLFATLAGILLVNGADIVRADIHTLDGIAIDEFTVTEVFGNDYLAEAMSRELSLWIEDLQRSLRHYITRQGELAVGVLGLEKNTKPVPQVFRRKARVGYSREGEFHRFEIACTDRPALLYDLAHRLSIARLSIRSATVETTGWQAHDSFVVACASTLDERMLESIRSDLLEVCEGTNPSRIESLGRTQPHPA